MNRPIMISAVLLAVAACAPAVTDTFDAGDEGWRITGDAQGSSNDPTYHSTGGNPGGYISATDDVAGGVWYFQAPSAFRGDFSSAYGTNLEFDLMQDSLNNQFYKVDIYLRGGGLELVYDTDNPGTSWTSYSISLTETAGWDLDELGGATPTQAQMIQVLGDVTDLQIRGEYVTGADTGSLDNVTMLPEPATLSLLGVGGLVLMRRRKHT